MNDTSLTAARIGKGKAVHHYFPQAGRTSCASGGMGDAPATIVEGGTITCKRCLATLAKMIDIYHGQALRMNVAHDQAARLQADGLVVGAVWASTSREAETVRITEVEITPSGAWIYYAVITGERKGLTTSLLSTAFGAYHKRTEQPQAAPVAAPVLALYGPDGRMHIVEGSGLLPFDAVWLTDTTTWDTTLVSVTTLLRAFTAYPPAVQAPAPVEVADLYVRSEQDGRMYRVLGSEQRRSSHAAWTVLLLEDTLTRAVKAINPPTLEARYVAVCHQGRNHQMEVCAAHDNVPGWMRAEAGRAHGLSALTSALDTLARQDGGAQPAKAPEGLQVVPDTVEAWKAYAEKVKADRDAAEAEVARLLRERDGAPDGLYCGQVVDVSTRGRSFRGRVSFIGDGRRVVHVKPLDGGLEAVAMRREVVPV